MSTARRDVHPERAVGPAHWQAARAALANHWREYLMEGACLGLFMISACSFVVLIAHPASPVNQWLDNAIERRALIGVAMGLTAMALIYSPWGKRSGAHLNPAVSLTFWRLGKISTWDALFYILSQFVGGVLGVALCAQLLPAEVIGSSAVNYVTTSPGAAGTLVALLSEAVMSFGMMWMVLSVSNRPSLNRYTGMFAGALVAFYITVEAPLSGMSMNPARTVGSAVVAHMFDGLWIYFAGPLFGMLVAATLYGRRHGRDAVLCCKLHHDNDYPCIFRCNYPH